MSPIPLDCAAAGPSSVGRRDMHTISSHPDGSCNFNRKLKLRKEFGSSIRQFCAWSEYQGNAALVQVIVVCLRDDTTSNHHNIRGILLLELLNQLRHQSLVACCLGADPNHMNIRFNGMPGHLTRGLEQWPHIHIKPHVSESGGHNLGASVMAILTHLANEDTRAAPILTFKFLNQLSDLGQLLLCLCAAGVGVLRQVDPADGGRAGRVAAVHLLQRIRDLSDGAPHLRRGHRALQQVALLRLRARRQGRQRGLRGRLVARRFGLLDAVDLLLPDDGVVDLADLHLVLRSVGGDVLVDPHDDVGAGVDPSLLARRTLLDLQLGHAGHDGLRHPSQLLHFIDDLAGLVHQVLRQRLHHVGASPGIHNFGDAGLLLQDELRVSGNFGGERRGQCNSFVERVGVQRLCSSHDCSGGLDARAHDVVVRVLFRQAPAAGLAMRPQQQRLRVFGVEKLLHFRGPQGPRSPELCNLHVEIHPDAEEEGKPRGNLVDRKACFQCGSDIFNAIGDGEAQLQSSMCSGLLHVIPGNGNGIVLGHVFSQISHDVSNNVDTWFSWVNVGVADHEFLQNVILNGPGECLFVNALFLGSCDVHGKDRQNGAVHGHTYRHLIKGNIVEKDLHILHTVNRYSRETHIAYDSRMITIISAMSRQIKGNAQALLTRLDGLLVEGIALFHGAKSSVLSDGPRADRVHGSMRATCVWESPRERRWGGR
mmetsp:Transcript_28252/g.47989  ORF Transcript_28252/g.47989 Transcript_28252/m.47989 type:complete len:708 (+) Transcript_28252:1254-3377(+)